MSWTLRKTDRALDDLADIWAYIATDNLAAADRLSMELLQLFDRTADHPLIGREAFEIGAGFRLLTRGRYLLIYRVIEVDRAIELVRVIHSARNWPSLFDS